MKSVRSSIAIGVLAAIAILLVVISSVFWLQLQAANSNKDQLTEDLFAEKAKFEELSEGLARSESSLANERELRQQLETLFGEELKLVREDLERLAARPILVKTDTITIPGDTQYISDTDFPSEYRFLAGNKLPVAHYLYKDRIFQSTVYDLQLNTSTIVAEDESGNKAAYTKATISSSDSIDGDKEYPIEISNSELVYTKPDKNHFMVAPHVDAGVGLGYNISKKAGEVHGQIGFSIFAVGTTRSDNTVRFLRVAGCFDSNSVGIGLQPALVNIAKPLPLVDDIWLGAGPVYGTDGWSIAGTVSSTF